MDESPLTFLDRWTEELRALQTAVEAKATTPAAASDGAQRLSQQLTGRTGDLPLSERGRCERELKSLQDLLASLKTQAGAKPKFSFKRSAVKPPSAPAPVPSPAPAPAAAPTPALAPSAPSLPPNAITLTARSDVFLSPSDLPTSPSPSNPSTGSAALALSSLSRCVVDLLPPPSAAPPTPAFSAIYLNALTSCIVLLPPQTSGSILIQDCQGCVLVLGGHQFRMHDSSNCEVFLQAGSTPIIERCKGLVFGRYPSCLSPPASGVPPPPPQDFDDPFATLERPSPNWRRGTMEEEGVFEADERWRSFEGRAAGWTEMLKLARKQ